MFLLHINVSVPLVLLSIKINTCKLFKKDKKVTWGTRSMSIKEFLNPKVRGVLKRLQPEKSNMWLSTRNKHRAELKDKTNEVIRTVN